MDSLDLKKIAAEVSIQHGIRVDADDPIMAVVTLNRIVFEQSVGAVLERLQTAVERFEESAGRVQVRAGNALAQEIKECTAALCKGVADARDSLAGENSAQRIVWHRGAGKWMTFVVIAAASLFGAGVWVGAHLSMLRLAGQ